MPKRYYDLDFRPTVHPQTLSSQKKHFESTVNFNEEPQRLVSSIIPLQNPPKRNFQYTSEYQKSYNWPVEVIPKLKEAASETSPLLPVQNDIDYIVKPLNNKLSSQKQSKVSFENGTLSKPEKRSGEIQTSNHENEGYLRKFRTPGPITIFREKESQTILDLTMDLVARPHERLETQLVSSIQSNNTPSSSALTDKPVSLPKFKQSSVETQNSNSSRSEYKVKSTDIINLKADHEKSVDQSKKKEPRPVRNQIIHEKPKHKNPEIILPHEQDLPRPSSAVLHQNENDKHSFLSYGWANSDPHSSIVDHKSFNVSLKKDDIQPFVQERIARKNDYEKFIQKRPPNRPICKEKYYHVPLIQSSTEYSDEYGGRKVHSPFRRPTGSSSFDKSFYKPTEKQVRKSDIYCVNTGVRMRQPIVHKKIDTVHHHHDMYRGLGNSNVKLNLPPNNRYQWLEHISNPQARQTFSHKDKNAEH